MSLSAAPTEEYAKNNTDLLEIYKGNSKVLDFIIISISIIIFELVRQCNKNSHDAWMVLINIYELSEEDKKA